MRAANIRIIFSFSTFYANFLLITFSCLKKLCPPPVAERQPRGACGRRRAPAGVLTGRVGEGRPDNGDTDSAAMPCGREPCPPPVAERQPRGACGRRRAPAGVLTGRVGEGRPDNGDTDSAAMPCGREPCPPPVAERQPRGACIY